MADTLRRGDFEASIDAVLSDDELAGDVMLRLEDQGIEDGPLGMLLRRQTSSDMLRSARRSSDVASMSAATGLSDSRVEATGYDLLLKRCKPAAQQILIKGPKGSGKTVLGIDIVRRLFAEFDGELSVATNVRGPDEHEAVTFVETMSGLLEWVRDTKGEKIALMDEWSTTMNAHAHPGGDVRSTVSRFVNALRKGTGGSTRLLIIGHEHDTDIAAILRTQADVVIHKAGKADEGLADQAAVYDGWQSYVKDDEALKIRGLADVPASSTWGADTNYFAYFEPDLDAPREQIKRGKLVKDWQQYQDEAQEEQESDLERIKCRGSKSGGGGCGQLTDHVSGFCGYHRDQWNGDDDPRRVTNDEGDDDT
ncbi:hypothetical protein [Halorubrum sp. ARQ200]|uniref:hypothetical protein n=1 Tax=Halorubrum sp. ARQ200 TaxID=1855872 RepID=UPI001A7E0DB7|nr:hypothetical protein [Halorubrum sp. ARQ200]